MQPFYMDEINVILFFGLTLIGNRHHIDQIHAHDKNYGAFRYVTDVTYGAVKGQLKINNKNRK